MTARATKARERARGPSRKVQGSKLSKDQQAALLACADRTSDAQAARKFGIRSPSTVHNYRRALEVDPELRSLYEAAKAKQERLEDQVALAEAEATCEVWRAIKETARKIADSDKLPSSQHLEALARVLEAGAKTADQRAEVELTRKMLDGRRAEAAGADPAQGGPPPGVRAAEQPEGGADRTTH